MQTTVYIDIYELVEALQESHGGKWLTVSFIKRSTGEHRVVTGRLGVRKHLAGGKPAYDFREKKLLPLWIVPSSRREDTPRDRGYRCVPIERITQLQAQGRRFVIEAGMAREVIP